MIDYDAARALGVVIGDVAVAREALAVYGGLRAIGRASDDELLEVPGIGKGRVARLRAAFELSKLHAQERVQRRDVVLGPRDVYELVWPMLHDEDREVFLVLGLDARNRVRLVHRAAVGSLTRCALTPRDVFAPLVRAALAHVVICHNHPSGCPSPSPQDIALTRQMREAGRLLGIAVLDHVVVAEEGYESIAGGES